MIWTALMAPIWCAPSSSDWIEQAQGSLAPFRKESAIGLTAWSRMHAYNWRPDEAKAYTVEHISVPGLLAGITVSAVVSFIILTVVRHAVDLHAESGSRCDRCGYDILSTGSGICPKCGPR